METNKSLYHFLTDYMNSSNPPGFAVLINGKWGSGKSHFIKWFIEQKKSVGKDFIYISLNGISSIREIESSVFNQLHPFLASKGAKFMGKWIKDGLKATVKMDLNNDGEADSVSIQIPDLKVLEYFNDAKERIFVFDDLERNLIEVDKFLGYINQSVEHKGFKVAGFLWTHIEEERFAIKLEPTCFYISFNGYLAKHPYKLTVGELKKQFYERTGKLLSNVLIQPSASLHIPFSFRLAKREMDKEKSLVLLIPIVLL